MLMLCEQVRGFPTIKLFKADKYKADKHKVNKLEGGVFSFISQTYLELRSS